MSAIPIRSPSATSSATARPTCWSTSSAPDGKDVSLFVEGPTPDWALPVPKLVESSPPGVKRFAFELDGLPPGASPDGAALKLTLVGGDKAYEFNVNLP